MNRLDSMFRRLERENRCGLIAYVTCGDPSAGTTIEVIHALEDAGADAIELGVPFSDPIADGPVIQAASFRALQRGTTMDDVFRIAESVRQRSQIPLIAFSYLNPLLRFGEERFADAASGCGIDAVLVTDLPPESSRSFRDALRARKLGIVFLLSPTSSDERVKIVDRATSSFIYYVSTTGVTGVRRDLDPTLIARLDRVRTMIRHPVAVGFGISNHEHFVALAPHCEAVVVGSAIVRAVGEGDAASAAGRAGAVVRSILGRAPARSS